MRFLGTVLLAFAAANLALAQGSLQEDLRSVRSPDGKFEIQVFVGQPIAEGTALQSRMAYRVLHQGKTIIETSFLGFEMKEANPLGEKPGLTGYESGSVRDTVGAYNWGICHFLQNGSQGRKYDIEMRAYDTGVAFRYVIPWSAPMNEILIESENTEFQFPAGARSVEANMPIADLPLDRAFSLPFVAQLPNGYLSIGQSGSAFSTADDGKVAPVAYTAVSLLHDVSSIQGPTMTTRLARHPEKSWLAVETRPLFHTPWRVIALAARLEDLRPPRP